MVIALGMAADRPGSKIMVCTDGQANVGLGDVSSKSPGDVKKAKETYENIGKLAKENGGMNRIDVCLFIQLFFYGIVYASFLCFAFRFHCFDAFISASSL
jgi:hypothetical protein